MSDTEENQNEQDVTPTPEIDLPEPSEVSEVIEQENSTPAAPQVQEPQEPYTPVVKEEKKRSKKKMDQLDLETAKIGFVGAGKMTQCIVEGLINYGKISPSNLFVSAPTDKNFDKIKSFKVKTTKRSIDIFSKYDCDIVFLCVHGSVIKSCYNEVRPRAFTINFIPYMKHPIYILSLIWGVKLNEIKTCLLNPEHPEKYTIEMHRIVLNAACAYGLGLCGIDEEPDSVRVSAPVRKLLSSIAKLEHVLFEQMDAACSIGGSGLAFAYYFINAMADGAFKVALERDMSIKFAAKTVQCATQCLLDTGKHPDEMKDFVSAPSGAAIFGVHVLDKADVASGVVAAVEAAHERARFLSSKE